MGSTSCEVTSCIPPWRMGCISATSIRISCSRLEQRSAAAVVVLGPRRHRIRGGLSLHATIELILAGKIDAQPALGAQIIAVGAKANVHDVLVARLLHELDRRAEIAVLRDQEGDVV